jgi:hypothetical protein
MAFLVITEQKIHYIGVKTFFLQIGQYAYQKIQNFMLISKMLTYLSDKMHPKKVLGKKLFLEKIVPKNLFFGQHFLGCILTLRLVDIFEIGIKI